MIKATTVDAVLDTVGEDEDPTEALVALVDEHEAWDSIVDAEVDGGHDGDRVAVIESSGAWWAVGVTHLRGRRVRRCETREEARGIVDSWCGA